MWGLPKLLRTLKLEVSLARSASVAAVALKNYDGVFCSVSDEPEVALLPTVVNAHALLGMACCQRAPYRRRCA